MSYDLEIISREEQKALILRDCVTTLKLPKVMGPAYQKIAEYMQEQGVEPKEAPFTCYRIGNWEKAINMKGFQALFSLITKKWEIEMGFPVTQDMAGKDTIEISILPAGKYIQTLHVGPYQKVGEAYKEIYQFVKEHQLTLSDRCYEFYLNDPHDTAKDKLETRILIRVNE
ncbi:GyrI-like domain-containing protein [candidate division KSB1 bacterium]|nr:GyrI-like domain-containing protein [candidate division KSB1 bacterium]